MHAAREHPIAFKIIALLVAALAASLLPATAATAAAAPDDRGPAPVAATTEASAARGALAPSAVEQTQVQIYKPDIGKCLAAHAPPSTTAAFVFSCNRSYKDQIWNESTVGDGYQYRNVASGMCLAAHAYQGAVPFQHPCNPAYRDQQWVLRNAGNSILQFVNVHSGLCMAIHGNQDGNRPFMHPCGNYRDQDWVPFV